LIIVALMFGLGHLHPFGNPRAEPAKGFGTLMHDTPVSARAVLITKCADCHSNETQWPVYAQVAPGSWLIERDIVEARKKMNLSKWDEIPAEQQQVLMAKIVHEVKSGDMPPLQYLTLHWDAKLSNADVEAITAWAKGGGEAESTQTGMGDAEHGRAVFEKRCTGCHALDVDREGPRLAGVYERKAGSVDGFTYSKALKSSGITWNDATLEKWLTDPDQLVPNNDMSFSVPKAEERRDLIAYFKQAKK
jgi:cytochrome c